VSVGSHYPICHFTAVGTQAVQILDKIAGGFTSPRICVVILCSGLALPQAVNRRHPTAAARV
jgi:hypothetical protein